MSALADVVHQPLPRLRAIPEERAAHTPAPQVWSAKQVIGHLIDSGVNNHARFVRASVQSGLDLPGYDQDAWVRLGGWQQRGWAEILALWAVYQEQLAHVIARLPPESLGHTLSIGGGEPVTLAWLTEDYVRHQLHHLAQIWERAEG